MDKDLYFTAVSEIEIRYKNKVKVSERPKINGSRDAERILRPLFNEFVEHREVMYALYLNRSNKVLGSYRIGVGGVSGVAVDPKLIFQAALKANASGIILAHNHPSSNRAPSQADIDLTKKIKQAGVFLEISLLDHLIILPDDGYYSFADEGHL
jgi:DNA repair protein RadC